MNKRFHVVIKDNQTGETEIELDTDCIIGALHAQRDGEDGSQLCSYTDCDAYTIAETIIASIKAGRAVAEGEGRLPILMALAELVKIEEERRNAAMDSKGEDGGIEIPFPVPGKNPKS